MTEKNSPDLVWRKIAGAELLPEGRVMMVTVAGATMAITHFKGQYAALDNRCPHEGGPLGEGTIENGLLRCPWHGWDFDPLSGKAPGFDDGVMTYPTQVREDGVYVSLEAPETRQRTVSDLMAETMVNWGVKHVFGMVGHSNLGLADAIRRQEEKGALKYIGIRHEGAAAFAASAYGKLTGRPAACLTIAGPGATNLLTGLWDAKMDRAPVLAITGQINTQFLGPGAFQEIDLAAAFSAVAAFSQTVLTASNHAELVNLALKNSILRRDVSHLIVPDEVQTRPVEQDKEAGKPEGRIPDLAIAPPVEAITKALKVIRASKRPIVIAGYGARAYRDLIVEFAERLNAPLLTTFKAKGFVADAHPLACGVLGRSGTPVASYAMNESDAIIVFGASFSKHTGITEKRPTVQVDFDPMTLGKFHAVTAPVLGDVGVTVKILLDNLNKIETVDQRPEVAERWDIWRKEKASRAAEDRGNGVNASVIFEAMNRLTPHDAVIGVDVGNNAYSFGRYFECSEQTVLISGYLGSIGFAYPAAIGAWAAVEGKRPVVAVTGDGGFGQYMGEILTAVKYKMKITHILLNNFELGKISKEQRGEELPVWQTSLVNPDFAQYAKNCGAFGVRVTKANELDDALTAAFNYDGPAMVEIITDPELN